MNKNVYSIFPKNAEYKCAYYTIGKFSETIMGKYVSLNYPFQGMAN